MKTINDFINLYSVQKTLRFELKPIGKTIDYIIKKGLLNEDEHRADSYQKVKKIIDKYHKVFIDTALKDCQLDSSLETPHDLLDKYLTYYRLPRKEVEEKKEFANIQAKLRKKISLCLTSDEKFKRIDKKELIQEDLIAFVDNEEERTLIDEFKQFTTYFTGFHKNRKNMYVADEKSTAIAYRLINENLPRFVDNITTFEKVSQSPIDKEIKELYNTFEEYLNVNDLNEMFSISYYSNLLTQRQIDVYNAIIGGKSMEDGTKIKGLNEYINLHNQQQTDKAKRIPKFKILYKQILSDKEAISWLPEKFADDNELLENIEQSYRMISESVLNPTIDLSLKDILQNITSYDLNGIFIKNDNSVTNISQRLCGNYSTITRAIEESAPSKSTKAQEKYFKSFDSFPIAFIDECLRKYGCDKSVGLYFSQIGTCDENEDLFSIIKKKYENCKELLNTEYPYEKDLSQDKSSIEKIKELLDSIKVLQWFVKPLLGSGTEPQKDESFYGDFSTQWDILEKISLLYDKARNYATRKPYSEKKIKLNFENSTLLDGWDVNKEPDNTSVILHKDGLYYLGIMDKRYNRAFEKTVVSSDKDNYQKMRYKLLPGANKMLPKVFFSNSRIQEFKPSERILANYKNETHIKGDNFNLKDCHDLIDFFKRAISIHEDWKYFDFHFSDTSQYDDLSGFYHEVEQQGYKINFEDVSAAYIHQLIEEGKLYLFQIYNKDFSPYSKGTPNMHTLYWKMLFDPDNLSNVVYKLNGNAEVFYRKSSIKANAIITHKKGEFIDNSKENNKKQSLFAYDIIKDKRYTIDKFQFHVPITLNFKGIGINNINTQAIEFLKESSNLHIIGIDRGERNLLYLSMIDLQGRIVEQYSLNEIINKYNGNIYKTDYQNILNRREEERRMERESWKTIESIKELKEGYLSQVIHKITEMMVRYNAIVVLEDLNIFFKQGRQKVEKQVYQKFEKMLIDKLNYLVNKNVDTTSNGGLLKAYQFTNKFESFQKLGKQSGFLFYVPAWNTSKIDPVTGFTNMFDTHYENIEKSRSFFNKFNSIRYDDEKKWFEFATNKYSLFSGKAEGTRQDWTICTHGERIERYKENNRWSEREIDLSKQFIALFEKYNINIHNNLKDAIILQSDKGFFESLLYLFKLTVQMRNNKSNSNIDYLISPVSDGNGHFFDSRKNEKTLPKDADANGAYNIARKGLWAILKIKEAHDISKIKLAISNKEWLQFAQNKPYLK